MRSQTSHLINAFIRLPSLAQALLAALVLIPANAGLLQKQELLEAQTFLDNRDWEWYLANIPFFECPDPEIVRTYYYRWELVTKHLTYGSPNSGYSYTEFTDRPFWSGAYGSISCPAGHQLYEARWLRDPVYTQDYARYWFRTPGAEPRRYGCWIVDAIWAAHQVHPDPRFVTSLLQDVKDNYAAWEQRQFIPEVGLFWQNGHDDGMEFNINSRQSQDILRGANGYRPGFNAYMWADAKAIARIATLAGDLADAEIYEQKAAALKENIQKRLWDPKRDFYFPMSMREEEDKEGNIVEKHTLTYQSGRFAGSPHGREEHAYIPWQFNLPDPGREAAWRFLMDPEYFYADFGPLTVERNDPMFLLQKSCCWWSGQSWPYATSQTLKAMANVLHHYPQNAISRADYAKLLRIYALSHRKNGSPYIAEALHPDTGSFEGHDGYNHSEHYFHSSFNDLMITGLAGLITRDDDVLEVDPLASEAWPWFAIDDVPYHGHRVSILWDKDGTRYGKGAGLRLFVDDREIAASKEMKKIIANLPATPNNTAKPKATRLNYAVNNDGDYYPRYHATFTDPETSLDKLSDGQAWYTIHPPNRWTTKGSPNLNDSLEIDFGQPRSVDTVKLFILDDRSEILAPQAVTLERKDGDHWKPLIVTETSTDKPTGHRSNRYSFAPIALSELRVTFTHAKGGFTGLSEIEVWGDGELPYLPPPPKPGNLAYNRAGEGFPKASASFSDIYGGVPKNAIDGRINFKPTPVNRWTSYGSPSTTDWIEVDFGEAKWLSRAEVYLYDDKGGVQAPADYTVQYLINDEWKDASRQRKQPETPLGSAMNTVTFASIQTQKARILFTHQGSARSGVTELEFWNE